LGEGSGIGDRVRMLRTDRWPRLTQRELAEKEPAGNTTWLPDAVEVFDQSQPCGLHGVGSVGVV